MVNKINIANKNSVFRNAIRIIGMVQKILPSYLPLITIQTLITSLLPFVNIIYGSKILDGIADGKDKNVLLRYVWIMVLVNMFFGLIHWALDKKRIINEQYIVQMNDVSIGEKALQLDYEVLEKKETLELIKKARDGSNSSGGLQQFCTNLVNLLNKIVSIIYAIIIVTGLFRVSALHGKGMMFKFMNSPLSTAAIFMLLMLGVIIATLISNKYSKMRYGFYIRNVDGNRKFAYFFRFIYDYAYGKDVRIFNMKKLIEKTAYNYMKSSQKIDKEWDKQALKCQYSIIVINKLIEFTTYIFVGIKAVFGIISIGKMTLYVGALKLLSSSINELFTSFIDMTVQSSYIKNFTDFLAIKNEKYDGTLPIEKRLDNEYELEFKNVSFHYPNNDEMILKNISFKVKVGNKMAIVGRNGAGKTTFIKLLCRLYDPTEGEILLNGINIKKYEYEEYTKLFSVVFQDFRLFSFSVAENVATSSEYDEEIIFKCLKQSGIKERIDELPEGINTSILNNQDEGVEISGGEAQKIAIARALYKNAPVVILDEPTSALDPISELEIYEKFNKLVNEKTSIFISHRMSSCKFCDNIIVFDNGRIAQVGSHNQLMLNEDGIYYSLWNAQAKYYA